MKVQVSMDDYGYREKVSTKIPEIKKRTSTLWQEIDVLDLADQVGNHGHAMVPAHMVGGFAAKNCMAMQLFALDFDDGITFQEIKNRCDSFGLKISFAYHTFSSTKEQEKFRVVFAYEQLIEDTYIIKIIIAILHKIFPECDPMCKNLDRLFLGGKKLIYVDSDARIALVQLQYILYEVFNTK